MLLLLLWFYFASFCLFFVFLAGDLAYVNRRENAGIENDRKDKFFHNSHPGNNAQLRSIRAVLLLEKEQHAHLICQKRTSIDQ